MATMSPLRRPRPSRAGRDMEAGGGQAAAGNDRDRSLPARRSRPMKRAPAVAPVRPKPLSFTAERLQVKVEGARRRPQEIVILRRKTGC
jgi:hypothetical protein